MKSNNPLPALVLLVFIVSMTGCLGSKLGSAKKSEQLAMKVEESPNAINYAFLKQQNIPSLASRGAGNRGAVSGMAGTAVSLASSAIKKMIAKEKAKYNASYKYALTDLYFYDQLSTQSPFDPIGMQFTGFRLTRTFSRNGIQDTALTAEFELDTDNPYEIINNSVFRLKLKSLRLNYAKAKVASNGRKTLNMDFEIIFTTSYVNQDGVLFRNMELGRFYFFLRNAPLDKMAKNYESYYTGLAGKKLEGQSFIVPRSFGYHITGENNTEPSFSQGAYNIQINIKESSKNSFVNQLVIDNSGSLIDALGSKVKSKIK